MAQPEFKGKKYHCRWCWSTKHWGKECKFAEQGRKKLLEWIARKPKVNAMELEEEDTHSDEEPYEEDDNQEQEDLEDESGN